MPERKQDPEREDRITMEIVVDAYGPEEQALGWYCYLQNNLTFPFTARRDREHGVSSLRQRDEVQVVGMAPEDECEDEMFFNIESEGCTFAVPLAELEFVRAETDAQRTERAVSDWHYWVDQGYEF